ncbi:hypothetical protein [uncultured Parasutterella sp.]|uniref:hypothetical protein n=1 Tax=uncultured Parasutterella sp. TaxID=1263098 RepID=UPI0025993C99|nr:hypothetical protein [uncultured Parasutterella sp.]
MQTQTQKITQDMQNSSDKKSPEATEKSLSKEDLIRKQQVSEDKQRPQTLDELTPENSIKFTEIDVEIARAFGFRS